jgi:D-alanyl-D-alanine carboxypeptidase
VALALCASVAVPACGAETTPGRTELQRDADAITALGVTGVQVRVVDRDGRNLVATSGVADRTTGTPVPPDGHFRIASATKTFVATVVLQLAGEGRLGLDDTVERWLPGVVAGNGNDGGAITVRQLLDNTNGLPDDYPDATSAAEFRQQRYDVYTAEQTVARAMRHEPTFPAGTGWAYSNTGYVLLGMIVERVTGHPWHDEVDDRIVRPLGLANTTWPGTSPAVPTPRANAYQTFQSGDRLVDITEKNSPLNNGEAGLISTTADLNRFFRALLGGRLLPAEQLALMKQTVDVSAEFAQLMPGAKDGLGLFSRPLSCGGAYWGHDGGDSGYITVNGVTDDGRRSVVISMSSARADAVEHMVKQQRAADELLDNALCA